MSHLTIEKMDKINFLITEVSLECLGNKFYDIYGRQTSSLLGLIGSNTLRAIPTNLDTESELWKSLTNESKSTNSIRKSKPPVLPKPVINKQKRKRRASFSITNNEIDINNDPESLLVPMASVPKAAKISQRRSTIAIQLAKQTRKPTVAVQLAQFRRQVEHPNDITIAEMKNNLRKSIEKRYNAMKQLSESQEQKYRMFNQNANITEFYNSEQKNLFTQCNTLIRFIKFLQEDKNNTGKLTNIARALSELKDEY